MHMPVSSSHRGKCLASIHTDDIAYRDCNCPRANRDRNLDVSVGPRFTAETF